MDCPKSCDTEAVAVLPDDPLVEILSRVPVKSVCRFKCVSKAWRDLIADPHHRKKLPQTLEGFFFKLDQEHCESNSCGDDCGSDDEDREDYSTDGSDGEELPCQRYGFVDVLGTSVRPVDFSFLTELGSIEEIMLLHCCNGLLLFLVACNSDISDRYVVCNPATKHKQCRSLHFHLVQFWQMSGYCASETAVYSSETQAWSHNICERDYKYKLLAANSLNAYANGMLLLTILCSGKEQLAAVDVEGNIQKMFPLPRRAREDGELVMSEYIGQSQGCLHYICYERKVGVGHREGSWYGLLLIWVLQDYDRQQWVLKDTVSFSKLFGEKDCGVSEYKVVGIHPDHSLVFLGQHWDRKLISYHMDSTEVCDLCTLGHGYKKCMTPYVPHFSEFGA